MEKTASFNRHVCVKPPTSTSHDSKIIIITPITKVKIRQTDSASEIKLKKKTKLCGRIFARAIEPNGRMLLHWNGNSKYSRATLDCRSASNKQNTKIGKKSTKKFKH